MIEAEHSFKPRVRERERRTGGAQFNVVQHDLSGPPPPPRSVTYPLRREGFVGVILPAYRIRMRKTTEREVRAAAIAAVAIPLIKHEKHGGLGERRPKDRRSLANQESARERSP